MIGLPLIFTFVYFAVQSSRFLVDVASWQSVWDVNCLWFFIIFYISRIIYISILISRIILFLHVATLLYSVHHLYSSFYRWVLIILEYLSRYPSIFVFVLLLPSIIPNCQSAFGLLFFVFLSLTTCPCSLHPCN